MEPDPTTVGAVVNALGTHFGGPRRRAALPGLLLRLGSLCGDAVARLGWRPPIRSTALAELRRGVTGNPTAWSAETGIRPQPAAAVVAALPSTVQERWFGRLYLLKGPILTVLSLFWIGTGLIALTAALEAATSIIAALGLPRLPATALTIATSLLDVLIGLAIAFRRTCGRGLVAGTVLAIAYAGAATVLTPALWLDPLGPLVKIAPAVLLMLVALAILEDR
ncbi:DoxX-like family protein [Mangrovibrevibacter kandeliae]|uniref:DoxX-like family protein n=1 Tax=Mangrovibrevibacter kandeliae TaxID=2968473 RepID=UPI00211956C4|nr:DoxX-like family protein [Aurantimonas sp. CSK15Z-1]MCQ8782384.1 DoxX-like family protein [Aurantimonas sp. CSK15Z-1]